MFYIILFASMTILCVCCSLPIINTTDITFEIVISDWFSFLTFSGVLCGVFLLFRPIVRRNFNPNSKIYQIPKFEQKFLKKIKAEKFNKLVPDFGWLVKFKKEIRPSEMTNPEYYKRFVYESVCGSLLHFFSFLFSPFFFFFIHKELYITVGLFGMILIGIGSLMPVMLMRANRTRLISVYNRLIQKQQKNKEQK